MSRFVLTLIPLCLFATAASAQTAADQARYEACLDKAKAHPADAYEDALAWRMEAGGLPARHCVAVSLLALGQPREAADRLAAIGHSSLAGEGVGKTEMLSQSGNAYLLAEAPEEARGVLTEALAIQPDDSDILIDRARANAMLGAYDDAETDLTAALESSPGDSLALTLRAQSRLRQNLLEDAEADAEAAIAADPENVNARVVLGDIRETRRTGQIPFR